MTDEPIAFDDVSGLAQSVRGMLIVIAETNRKRLASYDCPIMTPEALVAELAGNVDNGLRWLALTDDLRLRVRGVDERGRLLLASHPLTDRGRAIAVLLEGEGEPAGCSMRWD